MLSIWLKITLNNDISVVLSILLLDDKRSLVNFVKSFRFAGIECRTEQDSTSIDGFLSSSSDAYAAIVSPNMAGSKLV